MGTAILIGLLFWGPAALFADSIKLPVKSRITTNRAAQIAKFGIPASAVPAPGEVGVLYRHQIKIDNPKVYPTYKLTAGRLPAGLKLDARGLIQGVPQKAGSYPLKIQATVMDALAVVHVDRQFTLIIKPRDPKLFVKCLPNKLTVSSANAAGQNITYLFSASGSDGLKLQSSLGQFRAGNNVVGKITTPLTVAIRKSTGQTIESLHVSPSVIQTAQKLNAKRLTYTRSFQDRNRTIETLATVNISLAPANELTIRSISLTFEGKPLPGRLKPAGGQTKITIKANQAPPPLYAEILLNQPGTIEAFWQVDGKPVTSVKRYKASAKRIGVTYPRKQAPLGKLSPGDHQIQFVIKTPVMKTRPPEATLVVQAGRYKKPGTIRLQAPQDNSELDYQALTFEWSGNDAIAAYRIEFGIAQKSKILFSAGTAKPIYALTGNEVKNHFDTGKSYTWRVIGLNAQKKIVALSPITQFVFKAPAAFQPGQIVVVTEATTRGRLTVNRLRKKYKLKTLETIALRTLDQTATVFGTQGSVRILVQQIRKERGVIQVQLNQFFRTMSEPQNDLQTIYSTLNLSAVHQHYRGKGVRVAIVDTGVDTHHPDLKQRVVRHANLIRNNPYRAEIHGTALAGVMAASINNFGMAGIAPQADLLALRACWQTSKTDPEGTCTTISIAKAMDMAIASDAQIVNMSFGARASDRLMIKLLEAGDRKGVLFVAPVGNQKNRKKLPFPASHSKVIAVGGWDPSTGYYPNAVLAGAADVCAPASHIFTTVPGKGYNFLSGTSISAAIVSGILAVAKEKNRYLGLATLPAFEGNICRWQEKLIHRSVCKP